MSAKITGQVWDLQLPRMDAWILFAMADHAHHDGTHVFPSQAFIAWKTGYSIRQVRRVQEDLKRRKILIPEGSGYRGVQHYRLDFSTVPLKPPFVTRDTMSSEDKMSLVTNPKVNKLLRTTTDKMSTVETPTEDKMTAVKMSSEDICDTTTDILSISHNNDARAEPSLESLKDTPPTPLEGESAPRPKRGRRGTRLLDQPKHAPEVFQRFREIYPKRTKLQETIDVWDRMQPDDTTQALILERVEARAKDDPDWIKEQGRYVPAPDVYLRNGRWKDEWQLIPRHHVKFVE